MVKILPYRTDMNKVQIQARWIKQIMPAIIWLLDRQI